MYSHSIFLAKHFKAAETLQSFQASNQYNKPHTKSDTNWSLLHYCLAAFYTLTL